MLGNVLKNLRKNIGWSQQQFADKAKIGVATIVKIEKGEKPSKKNLTKILNALCLNIDDLLGDPNLTNEDKIYLENKKYQKLYYG